MTPGIGVAWDASVGAAVGLFCSSGAALLFAWRDYMPTFTDASLIAAGTGALLWAVLATDMTSRRRAGAGLAGFAALEAAVFVRHTDLVVLGCAVVAVIVAWRLRMVPLAALGWWLGLWRHAGPRVSRPAARERPAWPGGARHRPGAPVDVPHAIAGGGTSGPGAVS